jgi:threonine dehydrogenase-like Zn-dependent dehydrogenase
VREISERSVAKEGAIKEMKAVAVFPRTQEVKIIEHEVPELRRPDQVKLRILDVGMCGTDKEICAFEYGTPPPGSDYLVIGHESLGEVIEVGPAVSNVKVGDLVVTTVRRPCPHPECRPCRAGYPDFCSTGDYTERGIKGEHGFMTEYVVDHQRSLHVVPPQLRDVAVLTEPLTIAEKAIDQAWHIVRRLPWLNLDSQEEARRLNPTAVVLGAGPVGLLGVMKLMVAGWETSVYALPPAPSPSSDVVEAIGGKYYSQGKIPLEAQKALFGHINLVYEATGASRLAFEALKLLGPNSVCIFTGIPSLKGAIEIDADLLMRNIVLKNQLVFGTVNASAEDFDAAIRDIDVFHQRWPEALGALITSRSAPEGAPGLLQGRRGGIKNVITFHQNRQKGDETNEPARSS